MPKKEANYLGRSTAVHLHACRFACVTASQVVWYTHSLSHFPWLISSKSFVHCAPWTPLGMLVAARDFRWKGSTGQGPVVLFARGLQRLLAKSPVTWWNGETSPLSAEVSGSLRCAARWWSKEIHCILPMCSYCQIEICRGCGWQNPVRLGPVPSMEAWHVASKGFCGEKDVGWNGSRCTFQ